MKILLATFWSVPHVGGVWRYMEQLRGRLQALGHEVDLMGPNDESQCIYVVNEDRRIGTDVLLEPVKKYLSPGTCSYLYIHPLIEYMEMKKYSFELGAAYLGLEKYDLIHTQDVISTVCISRVKPEGTALTATLHGSVAHEMLHHIDEVYSAHPFTYLAKSYYRQLEYLGATSAAYTITANNWLKEILINEFGVPAKQIKVMHYGYDIDGFLNRSKGDAGMEPEAGKKIILFAGRLVDLKGVHHLISALSELKNMRDDWVCWIAGSGESEEKLKSQAAGLGLQNKIVFLGNRDDLPVLMAKADIYVQPSLIENQPLSVVEAQISGLPVIVNNAGGMPEMVQDNVTGLIYATNDIHALCLKLNTLLADDGFRNAIGFNAKQWAMEHWSLDKGAENVLQVYHESIAKNGIQDYFHKLNKQQVREYFESTASQDTMVGVDMYHSLFSTSLHGPSLNVKKGTWDLITNSLPSNYILPNPALFQL